MKAIVFKSAQREFECRYIDTLEFIKARAIGNLLKDGEIVVGDQVEVEKIENEYVISKLYPRKSEIYRMLVREKKRKVTASNCDYLVIVVAASKPDFKRGILDRFLIRGAQWNLNTILVFNKMDEYDPTSFDIVYESERLKYLNVTCFEVSAKKSDYSPRFLKDGLEQLKTVLKDHTAIFLGQSGVGKSKIISTLSDGTVSLKSNEIGKVGKGTHTTTWSELIDCKDFYLIDSPGIRSFSLEDILEEDLIKFFPDLEKISLSCKFSNCSHEENAKSCAFHADSLDDVEKSILHSRLESYKKILEEVGRIPSWQKK